MKKISFLIGFAILLLVPIVSFSQTTSPISNGEQIISFDSQITIYQDSTIDVVEEINYYFPSPRHGIFRKIPQKYSDETKKLDFTTPIIITSVTDASNQPYEYTDESDSNYLILKIGDPATTVEGAHIYRIAYKVTGVLNYFNDHDELYWNVTGNEWGVPIGPVTTEVILPDGVKDDALKLSCYTGTTGSKEQNCQNSYEEGKADFSSKQVPLTIVVGWNKGIVTPIERQYKQPSDFEKIWSKVHYETAWYLLIPLLVLILLVWRYFRTGRDPFGRGTIAPEFEPPDKLLPGEMGTLIDEKADRQDITATIIDLAVRGYIKIKEKDKKFTLFKLKDAGTDFKDFEEAILEGVFGGAKEIKLAEVHEHFAGKVSSVEDDFYNSLVERKYFLKSPDKVRSGSCWLGAAIIILSPMFFITSIILAVSLFVSGILVLLFIRSTPQKTREGVIAKEKSLGFREFLYRAERYRVRWQEKEGIFEKYLPYALVFGIGELWAKNFQDIYKKPPDWYEGDWTTFSTVVFASSLNSFSSTATASFSPPSTSASSGSSGFGGGGSSGGGFGGGGGGSW